MVSYRTGGPELLEEVEPLWKMLREHVCSRSQHFGADMQRLTWKERRREILGQGKLILVELALEKGATVAYCICSITEDGWGEVDSIFVDEGHRGAGLGDELMRRAVAWLDSHEVKGVRISVTWGNEEVLPFYASRSFYPRSITLMRKQPPGRLD